MSIANDCISLRRHTTHHTILRRAGRQLHTRAQLLWHAAGAMVGMLMRSARGHGRHGCALQGESGRAAVGRPRLFASHRGTPLSARPRGKCVMGGEMSVDGVQRYAARHVRCHSVMVV